MTRHVREIFDEAEENIDAAVKEAIDRIENEVRAKLEVGIKNSVREEIADLDVVAYDDSAELKVQKKRAIVSMLNEDFGRDFEENDL